MRNATLDVTHIAEFQRKQVQHARNETDTARLDWCEENLVSFGWHSARAIINDHAGTPSSASTFRRAVDVAMEQAAPKLGDTSRTELSASPAVDLTAIRYEALIGLVTGKHAQQFLTEMCWDGSAPTQKQLEAKLDKMIEATR
jgi:hypothetical protein